MNFIQSVFLGWTVSSPLGVLIPSVHSCKYTTITPVDKTIHFSFPAKIQGDSYNYGISASEYDNQIAHSPTKVK
jgi:hypothetical protein